MSLIFAGTYSWITSRLNRHAEVTAPQETNDSVGASEIKLKY
jgi:hypothetical protein